MSGYVYYVTTAEAERVKIGYTRHHPGKRLKELQCGSPLELCIIASHRGSPSAERDLHERFSEYRLHGEWFAFSKEIGEHIRDVNRREFELAELAERMPERWCLIFHRMENGASTEDLAGL